MSLNSTLTASFCLDGFVRFLFDEIQHYREFDHKQCANLQLVQKSD